MSLLASADADDDRKSPPDAQEALAEAVAAKVREGLAPFLEEWLAKSDAALERLGSFQALLPSQSPGFLADAMQKGGRPICRPPSCSSLNSNQNAAEDAARVASTSSSTRDATSHVTSASPAPEPVGEPPQVAPAAEAGGAASKMSKGAIGASERRATGSADKLGAKDGEPNRKSSRGSSFSLQSLKSRLSSYENKFGREYMDKGSLFATDEPHVDKAISGKHKSEILPNLLVRSRKACRELVESTWFDAGCATIIFVNTILIGVEAELLTVDERPHPGVYLAQTLIIVWFGIELLLRIFGLGVREFFLGEEYRWNCFDFCLVLLAVVDFCAETLAIQGYSTMARIMRVLRVVRILRSLRIIRVLRYVREFRKMVFAIQGSMQTLLWALLLLFFLLYAFAVCFTTAVAEHMRLEENPSALDDALTASYGTLLRSFYSLYLAMSMGRAWGELLELLLPVGSFFVALFIIFITITIFGVLNVVTSVFVESAMQTAQHYKELLVQDKRHDLERVVMHMQKVFNQIDTDKSGTISLDEMESFLGNAELRMYVEALEISTADTRALFRLLDQDGSGRIEIEEFCDRCLRLKGPAQGFDIHCILYEVQRQGTKWADFMKHVESQLFIVETIVGHLVGFVDPIGTTELSRKGCLRSKTVMSAGSTTSLSFPVGVPEPAGEVELSRFGFQSIPECAPPPETSRVKHL